MLVELLAAYVRGSMLCLGRRYLQWVRLGVLLVVEHDVRHASGLRWVCTVAVDVDMSRSSVSVVVEDLGNQEVAELGCDES
jgi:hypothetical protein